ncbi:MAG TPA: hypothetical protein VNU26_16495 [Mycobacteriales bacterium]|nr:hypothetical protein [Mycobacteriales bacterium]
MDVLVSGSERAPRDAVDRLRRWRAPRWLVGLLAVAVVATAGAGPVAAVALRAGQQHAAEAVHLRVEATGTVSVRGRHAGGVLLVRVRNDGPADVHVLDVELDVPGVRSDDGAGNGVLLPASASLQLDVAFSAHPCAAVRLPGVLRVRAASAAGAEHRVELPVTREGGRGAVRADDVIAGCGRPTPADESAFDVAVLGGDAAPQGGGALGVVLLDVHNAGPRVELLEVTARVPGARFTRHALPAVGIGMPTGESVEVVLGFSVPACGRVSGAGRVVVTVRDAAGERQEVSVLVPGDAARRLVLGACAA